MKYTFPVVLSKGSDYGYVAYVPDADINTEGSDITDAIFMARDAIELWGLGMSDIGKPIPAPKDLNVAHGEDDILTLIDVDFEAFR